MRKSIKGHDDMRPACACPVCDSIRQQVFFEITDMPVFCNILWPTKREALECQRGKIKLVYCETCSLIRNITFDPTLLQYTQEYENSLHYSLRFQEYAKELAAHLINKYHVRGKNIIEIGCGKGDFLTMLCELGGNNGVGFDPSYDEERTDSETTTRITFIRDYYSERYANLQGDLICCRHTLEHVENPKDFLNMVRRSIGESNHSVIFFEVPNVLFTLRDLAVWDIIYEHCLYFCPGSLKNLFNLCGFNVMEITAVFAGQFLCIEAFPDKNSRELTLTDGKGIVKHVSEFVMKYRNKVEKWQRKLKDIERSGRRVVVWGSGSKGVTFLNVLKIQELIEYVVDVNPHKQGKYVAGTGQQIVHPGFLKEYKPDIVIVMNPIYHEEIQNTIEKIGIDIDLVSA